MKIQAYLGFKGECNNALNYYKSIFGGDIINEQSYNDVDIDLPENYRDKLQHAELKGKGFHFMAYDVAPDTPLTSGTNINMSIDLESKEKAKTIFEALSANGTVHTNFQEMPWNAFYGRCSDKYNITWMINYKK